MLSGFRPVAKKRSFSGFFAPPVLAMGPFALAADAPAQVAIQGGRFNYFVGVRRATNGVTLFIERNKGRGGSGEIIESMNLPPAKNVRLRVTANKAKCGLNMRRIMARGKLWPPIPMPHCSRRMWPADLWAQPSGCMRGWTRMKINETCSNNK